MNKDEYMKKANTFNGDHDCFIHAEMKDGDLEQVIAGNGNAIMYALTMAVERICEIIDIEFEEAIQEMFELHTFYETCMTNDGE